jgi:hypothetical protein
MSKKKKDFRVLSDRTCIESGCEHKLKQNLIDKNPDALRCYSCHMRVVRKNPRYGGRVQVRLHRTRKNPNRQVG